MNKKGLTLTELMAVIAIIAIIILIAVPSIIAIYRNMNERTYNSKKEDIMVAAELYAKNNPDIFNGRNKVNIYVRQLLAGDYVAADAENGHGECEESGGCVIDPVNKTSMNDDWVELSRNSTSDPVYHVKESSITGEEEIVEGTLVEQVCARFNSGTFSGKSGSDYCGCKFSDGKVTGLYKATKNPDGSLVLTNTSVKACIISGDERNNYLRYDGVMWRVLGIYDIYNNQSKLVAKMITNDTVD